MTPPPASRYLLLAGCGKSGSKRVLRVLDASRHTHCRCEPNSELVAPMEQAGWRVTDAATHAELAEHWDASIDWTRTRMSALDSLPVPPKAHHRLLLPRLGLQYLLRHARLRRKLALFKPDLKQEQWMVPRWMASPAKLSQAILVIKTGPKPGWIPWLLEHRPQAGIIHVVRHPGAFLHSHIHRWLCHQEEDRVARAGRERLARIIEREPAWADPFAGFETMNARRLELLYWLYVTTTLHQAGHMRPQYRLLKDEDMALDPIHETRALYKHCSLPWSRATETYLQTMETSWRQHTSIWHHLLEPDDIAGVKQTLERSAIASWWQPDQRVSRHDYVAH